MTTVTIIAISLGVLSLLSLWGSLKALRQADVLQTLSQTILALCFLAFAGLCLLGALSLKGYEAFTHEQIAATITVMPLENNQFQADIVLANGDKKSFKIAGDQLLVDAAILKWKPIANLLGLHTSYELMRISGRYLKLNDEQTKPHTVYALRDEEKWIDLFEWRRRFAQLHVLFDAEYGSAAFVPAQEKQQYVLLVSTSGLIFRKIITP